MRAAISLLTLLFSMCGAEPLSTQTEVSKQVDIYAELKELRDMVVEQRTILKSNQDELKKMEAENAAMKQRLVTSEHKVVALEKVTAAQEKEIRAAPKVAFSAALNSGYIQAGATDLNVVFPRVITNVGGAYSSVSGFFTAPVKGVYYFRFTVRDNLDSRWMIIYMHKNGEVVLGLAEYESDGHQSYLSSGVTLQLEVGDKVNLKLSAGYRLFDSQNTHCIFSGFLLFPL
ncbi:complement C1q-like protein 4 [Engraulis encrasicolus]|uniref:complement C1q-like protein 4 n=1 Tax=Engraulis encrasicolus TaxID=184585 RepID=UPI002FD380DB